MLSLFPILHHIILYDQQILYLQQSNLQLYFRFYHTTQNEFLKTQAEFKIMSAETMIREITIDNIPYINLSEEEKATTRQERSARCLKSDYQY